MEAVPAAQHTHCERCVKLTLCASVQAPAGARCPLTSCPAGCGRQLHTCKLPEHQLLCPEIKVACINSGYGCPLVLPRRRRADHLRRCPASVVLCMAEWSRWPHLPTDGGDRRRSATAVQRAGKNGATANCARSQRGGCEGVRNSDGAVNSGGFGESDAVLEDGVGSDTNDGGVQGTVKSDGDSERRALDNGLAADGPEHPPAECGAHSHVTVASCNGGGDVDVLDPPNNYLFQPLDDALTARDERLLHASLAGGRRRRDGGAAAGRQPPPVPLLLPGTYDCSHLAAQLTLDPDAGDKSAAHPPGLQRSLCSQLARGDAAGGAPVARYGQRASFGPPPSALDQYHNNDCVHKIARDLCRFCRGAPEPTRTAVRCSWQPRVGVDGAVGWRRVQRTETLRAPPTRHDLDAVLLKMKQQQLDEQREEAERRARLAAGAPPPRLRRAVEAISRHQKVARTLYRFQCARPLRRDEYAAHCRRVHGDVGAGADGWLQLRCPLAQHGCPHVVDRLCPDRPDQRFVVSPVLESVGVTSVNHAQMTSHSAPDSAHMTSSSVRGGEDGSSQLLQLPFEVLQHIARMLDPFSLNHLSLTCCLLRDVCATLLESRGLVMLVWAPLVADGVTVSWRPVAHSWRFSHAFAPVQQLRFHETSQVSDHLASCPYNHRSARTQPFSLIPGRGEQRCAAAAELETKLERLRVAQNTGPEH